MMRANGYGRSFAMLAGILAIGLLLLLSCNAPTGLKPVAGIEGVLHFTGTWPDSIQGAALVALDDLPTDLTQAASHLVNYSTPAPNGSDSTEYFLQLRPGTYFLIAMGLTMDPAVFAANLDSIIASGSLPVVLLDNDLISIPPIYIASDQVKEVNRTIHF